MMTKRTVTVVVPTRDRPSDLAACLRSVIAADNGSFAEIIIVDDASAVPYEPDPSLTTVPVTVLRHDTRTGPDRCRNEAARVASGDDIGFLDDDARVPHDWFDVVSACTEDGLRLFTGRVLPFDSGVVSRARQWRYDRRYAPLVTGQPVSFFAGGNSVVDRELFLRAGGFPELSAGGDNGLVTRMAEQGVPCRFVSELRILHRNGKGFPLAAKQAWRAGRSAPVASATDTITGCARTLGQLRTAPLDVGVVNGALQLLNTAGRLVGRVAP
jgi:glycosyltransferase involved in cell wall biosynthesis